MTQLDVNIGRKSCEVDAKIDGQDTSICLINNNTEFEINNSGYNMCNLDKTGTFTITFTKELKNKKVIIIPIFLFN